MFWLILFLKVYCVVWAAMSIVLFLFFAIDLVFKFQLSIKHGCVEVAWWNCPLPKVKIAAITVYWLLGLFGNALPAIIIGLLWMPIVIVALYLYAEAPEGFARS